VRIRSGGEILSMSLIISRWGCRGRIWIWFWGLGKEMWPRKTSISIKITLSSSKTINFLTHSKVTSQKDDLFLPSGRDWRFRNFWKHWMRGGWRRWRRRRRRGKNASPTPMSKISETSGQTKQLFPGGPKALHAPFQPQRGTYPDMENPSTLLTSTSSTIKRRNTLRKWMRKTDLIIFCRRSLNAYAKSPCTKISSENNSNDAWTYICVPEWWRRKWMWSIQICSFLIFHLRTTWSHSRCKCRLSTIFIRAVLGLYLCRLAATTLQLVTKITMLWFGRSELLVF